MKGLLLKDWYQILRYQRAFLIVVVAFSIGSATAGKAVSAFFAFYPCLMAGLMVPSLIAYDEKEKWNVYAQTLPLTRTQYVTGKYLMGLCIAAAMTVLCALIMLVDRAGLSGLSIRFVACLVMQALLLPFQLWLGAEKGRLLYGVVAGVFAALAVGGWMSVDLGGDMPAVGGIPLALAALVLYALSWRLSVALYRKREM